MGGLSNSGEDLLRKIAAFFEQVTVRKVPDSDAKEKHTHAKENYTHANETCVGNASATPLTPSPSDVSVCDEGKEAGGREGVETDDKGGGGGKSSRGGQGGKWRGGKVGTSRPQFARRVSTYGGGGGGRVVRKGKNFCTCFHLCLCVHAHVRVGI